MSLAREMRFFELARRAAYRSDYKVAVGAIAVCGSKVVASASSENKTSPLQAKYNRYRKFNTCGVTFDKNHAEIGIVRQLKKTGCNVANVHVYVYRPCKRRDHGVARPCAACMQALRDMGVRYVHYTTDVGYAQETIL